MLDRMGRIKPCGGAIPPRLIKDFDIPDHLLVAKSRKARMISPKDNRVDIPIDGGFVGMVNRNEFDEWLRQRAVDHGAHRQQGTFERLTQDMDGTRRVHFEAREGRGEVQMRSVRARLKAPRTRNMFLRTTRSSRPRRVMPVTTRTAATCTTTVCSRLTFTAGSSPTVTP